MRKFNLPGAFWVALILGLNQALQTLDVANMPQWAALAIFVVAAVAKALQEAQAPSAEARATNQQQGFVKRFLFN